MTLGDLGYFIFMGLLIVNFGLGIILICMGMNSRRVAVHCNHGKCAQCRKGING